MTRRMPFRDFRALMCNALDQAPESLGTLLRAFASNGFRPALILFRTIAFTRVSLPIRRSLASIALSPVTMTRASRAIGRLRPFNAVDVQDATALLGIEN